MDLAEDVPKRDVDAARGRAAHDAVPVPEMLAVHGLPEMLDPRRILSDDEGLDVFDGTDHRARVPFERGLAPAPQPGLVGEHLDEHPVAHPGMAHVGFDVGDLHPLIRYPPPIGGNRPSITS